VWDSTLQRETPFNAREQKHATNVRRLPEPKGHSTRNMDTWRAHTTLWPGFFLFSFFFPFPQICEVALSGSVIIFFNFLMLRHWLNPQWNLALNGDRYFLDSKTLVKKKASKVKLESKYEEKKFIKRISILLKKGIL